MSEEWIHYALMALLPLLLLIIWALKSRRVIGPISPIEQELPESSVEMTDEEPVHESPPEFDQVLSFMLLSNPNEPFGGIALLQTLLTYGLRFGKFDIFHYHELDRIQFSVASAVNPGTFDIDDMPQFTTLGLTFFMSLNDDTHLETHFEKMLQIAQKVAKELGGYLVNDQREALVDSKIQDYRKRVRQHQKDINVEGEHEHAL